MTTSRFHIGLREVVLTKEDGAYSVEIEHRGEVTHTWLSDEQEDFYHHVGLAVERAQYLNECSR